MDTEHLSLLSSLKEEFAQEDYIHPHYKESYRLAIDHLLSGGRESYEEFLKGERVGNFLSEEELLFITGNAQQLPVTNHTEEANVTSDGQSSTGTYWPIHSDVETPDLDLGWPEVSHERLHTSVNMLFQPPRQNSLTIKEVVRKHVQDARQVIAIVMDMFTDVDIFKETVDAAVRGVPVYVLLDHLNLKGFLAMAENQDIKIQQLRNMRVRTVKGQDYVCRSGAKFHGAMKQNFLLVDCKSVVYGSYSFTWSFEKINLSMVQVITGHLVQSYDEEFRMLFARSAVPAELCPPVGLLQDPGHGKPTMALYVSSNKLERMNHVRQTLDAVYLKTHERQVGMNYPEVRLHENPLKHMLVNDQRMGVYNHMPELHPAEMMSYFKRHSYAGERQEVSCLPKNMRHGASNWNISGDAGCPNGRRNNPVLQNYSQAPQICRGQNMHQLHNGKHVVSRQQQMPMLEDSSKSFMRTWRIESYLQKHDDLFGDSCEVLDQYDDTKPSSGLHSRMRSSLVFKSAIPEHLEKNCYASNSATNLAAAPGTSSRYSSMQWNTPEADEKRRNYELFTLKGKSLQVLDDTRDNLSYNAGRTSHHCNYASLGRAKGGTVVKQPDMMADNWYKRHSVADPRSNTDHRDPRESPAHMYGLQFSGRPMERATERVNAHHRQYGSNLNEDQRSVSHYDVKNIRDMKSPPSSVWQEPISRTVSAATLDEESKESMYISTGMGSPHFLKNSSKKIRSLLNIPEKKEARSQNTDKASSKSGGSTDTLMAEDEEQNSGTHRNPQHSSYNANQKHGFAHAYGKPSTPRFKLEEHDQSAPTKVMPVRTPQRGMLSDTSTRAGYETGNSCKEQCVENHQQSRFDSFRAPEKKPLPHPVSSLAANQTQEKAKGLIFKKGCLANEHNLSRPLQGHHENKLGKFFQRMGGLINKTK